MTAPMRWLALAFAVLFLASPADSRTWYITPDGAGDAPTIQAGMSVASSGDTVLVACGTYHETGITLRSGVVMRSEGGTPDCVTIDSELSGSVILAGGLASSTRLEGFTITGGWATSGGGLRCDNTSLTVSDCRFIGNSATDFGGAVTCDGSSPSFTRCTFSDNSAGIDGGGIACYFGSSPLITDCDFIGNSANWGGGVLCWSSCSPSIIDCTFSDNVAGAAGGGMTSYVNSYPSVTGCVFYRNTASIAGGGIDVWSSSSVAVAYCTFVENSAGAGWGAGVACAEFSSAELENTIVAFSREGEAVSCDGTSGATLSCCDVFGNDSGDWVNCIAGQAGANGNSSTDPLFCNADNDDFRLQWGSPCLPAHSNGCDLIGAFGPGNCPSLALEKSTWGRIKASYRTGQ